FAELWGWAAGRPARRWLAGAFAAVAFGLPLAVRGALPVPFMFGSFADAWRHPYSTVGLYLRTHARPGDTLAMWGWFPQAFVESALPQATREALTELQIRPWPQRDSYYRPRYLADFERSQPAFFVDAVGPGAFGFPNRTGEAHEQFPAFDAYLRSHYRLAEDTGQCRIYLRLDRAAPR
ncbi:MAG TPA: hypothetical protein VMD31_05790, partial [Opitutaceae bacterium]|nr:hypothetical protein [Opitutaceae bacterium]